jgi:hypothetical protein
VLEEDEYCEEIRLLAFLLGSTEDEAAEDLVSLSSFTLSYEVLSWD